MAFAGQTLENPVSGERITFLQTAADTDGRLLEFELELAEDGHVPGAHVHPEQEERFHVLEGTMQFRLGLRKIVAGPGETVVVPAGRVHRFANGGEGTARVRVEVEPALDMEQLSRPRSSSRTRATRRARACPSRCTSPCSSAAYEREVRAPFPPAWVVRVLMAPLAALARRRGHAERYVLADVHAPVALPARVPFPLPLASGDGANGSCNMQVVMLTYAGMSVAITIRDVPDAVRAEHAGRAARAGKSLQEYLRGLLIETADRPAVDDVIVRARARVETTGARVDAATILAARDADRR